MKIIRMKRNAVGTGKDSRELVKKLTKDLYEIHVKRARAWNRTYELMKEYENSFHRKLIDLPKEWDANVLKKVIDSWKDYIQGFVDELNLLENFKNEGVLNKNGIAQLEDHLRLLRYTIDSRKKSLSATIQKKRPTDMINLYDERPYTVSKPTRPYFADSMLLGVKKDPDAGVISRMYFYLEKAADPLNKAESFAQKAKGETAKNYAKEFNIAFSKLRAIQKAMYDSYME